MIHQTQSKHQIDASPGYPEKVKQMVNALLMSRSASGIFKTMDERLEQLITETQQHAPQSEARQLALSQLVDEILRSRKICRPLRSQPLFGVYQELYELVRQQLLHDLDKKLNQYNPKQMPVRTWINTLKNNAFRTILEDAQLKKLALEAQRYRFDTELRQYALGELVEAIRLSGRLCRPGQINFSREFYNLLYDEAVTKTLTYICLKINNYDPERGDKKFMNWVNFRLSREFIDCRNQFREPNIRNLASLEDLDSIMPQEEQPSLFERVREYLEDDTENIFKQAHIRNRPDANFSAIALARFSGKSWEEISTELRIPLPTLSRFFQRTCEKFRYKFRQCI